MSLSKKGFALALSAALGGGFVTSASADVYSRSQLAVQGLNISYFNFGEDSVVQPAFPAESIFTFNTQANAKLDNIPESAANESCFGVRTQGNLFGSCVEQIPVLSGDAANASAASANQRGESDYSFFGADGTDYSNAESEITTAFLVDFQNPTGTEQIAETNLVNSKNGSGGTVVQSTTELGITFALGENATFVLEFEAEVDALAEVTGASQGVSQSNVNVSVSLSDGQGTVFGEWIPRSTDSQNFTCLTGLDCDESTPFSLNSTLTSSGAPSALQDTGDFRFTIAGLESGIYVLGLAAKTSTQAINIPAPGSLLLMGIGLLAAGSLRRVRK